MPGSSDAEYAPLSQPKGKKHGNGLLYAFIAFGLLVLGGGGVGAYIWYSTSHKAAENAALVSKFPLISLKLYKSTSQVFVLSDQEKQSCCIVFCCGCWSPYTHKLYKLVVRRALVTSSCKTSRGTFRALALEKLERARRLELSDYWIISMMGRFG
jgi:hypothetical protein